MTRRKAWRGWFKIERLWLYVYVCRRPSGWGRHFGYSGITNSLFHRGRQHERKDWYDLAIKRRTIRLGRMPRGLGLILEYLLIKVTLPVYNVQHNRHNPRRIKPARARAQRIARDMGYGQAIGKAKDIAMLVPVAGVVLLATGLWMGVIK